MESAPGETPDIRPLETGRRGPATRPKLMNHKILSIPIPPDASRVSASRTSWVDRFRWDGRGWFLKTYVYPAPFGPLRGVLRNTFLAPSRAQREWRALKHLAREGLQPDLAAGLEEQRVLGFLLRSRLLTLDFGGEDLRQRLARGTTLEDEWQAIARFVRRMHESGLRDPDLKARNLLLRRSAAGRPEIAKIDASSSRLVRRGPRWERARVRDLAAFTRDLLELGVERSRLDQFLDWQAPPAGKLSGLLASVPGSV